MNALLVEKRTITEKLTYKGVEMVDVSIAYPFVSGGPVRCSARFNAAARRQAQKLKRYAAVTLYEEAVKDYEFAVSKGYPFRSYELIQVYEVTLNAQLLLSLYYDVYEYTGGAHGNTERTGETWDFRRCRKLDMKDLFTRGYDYVTPILAAVTTEALRRQASGEAQYFDGLPENIRKYFEEKNYYLTCAALEVFYPLYSIAPYYVGIQVFAVPYGVFGSNFVYPIPELCS